MYSTYRSDEKYILTTGEKAMLITVSILIIINGLMTMLIWSALMYWAQNTPASLLIGTTNLIYSFIIGIVLTATGIISLFKKRWAYIISEAAFVIDIFVWLNFIFAPQSVLLMLYGVLGTAVCGAKIFFCHKCQESLSDFSQTSRKSYASKRQR